MSNPDWSPDQDDADSVDDLVAHNVSKLRLERMDDDAYWLAFTIDGKEYSLDLVIRPGSRKDGTRRRIRAFNRGDLP